MTPFKIKNIYFAPFTEFESRKCPIKYITIILGIFLLKPNQDKAKNPNNLIVWLINNTKNFECTILNLKDK